MSAASYFLTISVPVHNSKNLIAPLLSQLQALQRPDIELLFVDDHSSDGSAEFVRTFFLGVANVRVIANRGEGVAEARNTGVHAAYGEYFWFIDADDQIQLEWAMAAIAHLRVKRVDVMQFGYQEFDDDAVPTQATLVPIAWQEMSGAELFTELAYNRIWDYSWAHIARRALYLEAEIVFPDVRIYEDLATTYQLFQAAGTALLTTAPIYLHQIRLESIVTTHFRTEVVDSLAVADTIEQTLMAEGLTPQSSLLIERVFLLVYGNALRFKQTSDGRTILKTIQHRYLHTRWAHTGSDLLKTRMRQCLMFSGLYSLLSQWRNLS